MTNNIYLLEIIDPRIEIVFPLTDRMVKYYTVCVAFAKVENNYLSIN